MKLTATIGDYQTEVQLQVDGARVSADVGGRGYELELGGSGDGFLLIHNGRVFNCQIEGEPESGKTVNIAVGTTQYAVTLTDPKRLRGSLSAGAHADQVARILAPMPGKVVRVMVEVGAQVAAGDGIVVVEAMKMQNEMKSPKTGTVVAISVEPGVTVNAGDLLAVIE